MFVLVGDTPQEREITIGLSNANVVEVKNGLSEGDQVILNPKVLVVDDEPNIRELVQVALNFHGCSVTTGATGEDALQLAYAFDPDLIVLDVLLPDIDGFEVASRLSDAGGAPAVILISSRDRGDFGPLVKASGARGFVAKAELSAESVRALLDG